jgi:nucleotide-binding universal stress UspA family protein
MLKKVLVPLDGSRLAHMALDFATHIIDANCEITLLTAIQKPEIPIYGVNPMIIVESEYADIDFIRKDAQRNLEGVAETLKDRGFHATARVEIGEPAHIIVQVANTLDVDMIIMSTHGRSGVSRWLFGSVTGRVLSMAPRPVLVVPSYELQQKFEREIAEMNFG